MKKVYVLKSLTTYQTVPVIHGVFATLEGAEEEMKRLLREEVTWYDFEIDISLFFE